MKYNGNDYFYFPRVMLEVLLSGITRLLVSLHGRQVVLEVKNNNYKLSTSSLMKCTDL